MASHRLDLGALDLVSADGGGASFWFYVLAEGFNPGSPEAVKATVATLWRDGDDSRINRFGNRVVTFQVQLCAPDSAALGQAERALWLECQKKNLTLTWQHPDGFGFPTVYEVLNAQMDPGSVDDLALMRDVKTMVVTVTLECRPWPRSEALTTVPLGSIATQDVFTVPVGGSSRAEGAVRLTASAGQMEYAIVFTDPAMVEYGYDPSDSTTWADAPEGRYAVWINSPGVVNDVLTATVGSQVARTRLEAGVLNWAPIGTLDLGARRDGTLGAFSIAVTRNGSPVASPVLRLYRMDPVETSLTYIEDINGVEFIIDSPGIEHPRGGAWSDGVSLLNDDDANAWSYPVFTPGETGLYVEAHANASAAFAVAVDYYMRWHTTAAE